MKILIGYSFPFSTSVISRNLSFSAPQYVQAAPVYEDKALEASSEASLHAGVCMFYCNLGTKCFL